MRKNSRTSAGSQISLRERIVDNLELPKDLMLGAAIVTVTGRGEAVISNYKGILEYEDSFIRVQTNLQDTDYRCPSCHRLLHE